MTPSPPAPRPPNLVGERLGAILIDGAVFYPVNALSLLIAATAPRAVAISWLLLAAPAYTVYAVAMHTRSGQTLGKKALGIEVVRARDGRPAGLWNAIRRELPGLIFAFTGAILLVQVVARGDGALLNVYSNVIDFDRIRELSDRSEAGEVTIRDFREAMGLDRLPNAIWANAALQWFWLLAEFATMLVHPHGRALHDLIGGTVVRRRQPPPP